MNQKEYELIANTIKGEFFTSYDQNADDYCIVDGVEEETVFAMIEAFADSLATYPTFDRKKFLALFNTAVN